MGEAKSPQQVVLELRRLINGLDWTKQACQEFLEDIQSGNIPKAKIVANRVRVASIRGIIVGPSNEPRVKTILGIDKPRTPVSAPLLYKTLAAVYLLIATLSDDARELVQAQVGVNKVISMARDAGAVIERAITIGEDEEAPPKEVEPSAPKYKDAW